MSQQVFSSVKGKTQKTSLIGSLFRSAPACFNPWRVVQNRFLDLVLIYHLKEKPGYAGIEANIYGQALKIE